MSISQPLRSYSGQPGIPMGSASQPQLHREPFVGAPVGGRRQPQNISAQPYSQNQFRGPSGRPLNIGPPSAIPPPSNYSSQQVSSIPPSHILPPTGLPNQPQQIYSLPHSQSNNIYPGSSSQYPAYSQPVVTTYPQHQPITSTYPSYNYSSQQPVAYNQSPFTSDNQYQITTPMTTYNQQPLTTPYIHPPTTTYGQPITTTYPHQPRLLTPSQSQIFAQPISAGSQISYHPSVPYAHQVSAPYGHQISAGSNLSYHPQGHHPYANVTGLREPRESERRVTYHPYTRVYTDYEERVQMVPIEKVRVNYYQKIYETNFIPKPIQEHVMEVKAVEHTQMRVQYIPVEKKIIHLPKDDKLFAEQHPDLFRQQNSDIFRQNPELVSQIPQFFNQREESKVKSYTPNSQLTQNGNQRGNSNPPSQWLPSNQQAPQSAMNRNRTKGSSKMNLPSIRESQVQEVYSSKRSGQHPSDNYQVKITKPTY